MFFMDLFFLFYRRFYDFPHKKHHNQHKNNKRPRRHIEVVREHQSGYAPDKADEHGQENNPRIVYGKEVGRHLWNGNERHQQHDSYQTDTEHDGYGNEKHHRVLDEPRRQAARFGKLRVERHGHDAVVVCQEKQHEQQRQNGERKNIGACDGQDISEKIFRKIGRVTRREEREHNAHSHSQRPENRYCGVFAHALLIGKPLDAESRKYRENHCRKNGIKPPIKTDAQSAE